MASKEMSLEQLFEKLEKSIEMLEDADISLEDSFKVYKRHETGTDLQQ